MDDLPPLGDLAAGGAVGDDLARRESAPWDGANHDVGEDAAPGPSGDVWGAGSGREAAEGGDGDAPGFDADAAGTTATNAPWDGAETGAPPPIPPAPPFRRRDPIPA